MALFKSQEARLFIWEIWSSSSVSWMPFHIRGSTGTRTTEHLTRPALTISYIQTMHSSYAMCDLLISGATSAEQWTKEENGSATSLSSQKTVIILHYRSRLNFSEVNTVNNFAVYSQVKLLNWWYENEELRSDCVGWKMSSWLNVWLFKKWFCGLKNEWLSEHLVCTDVVLWLCASLHVFWKQCYSIAELEVLYT